MNIQGHRLIGFSGHMTDAPDRQSPRFPETLVESVRQRVRAVLKRQDRPLHGVSSAARGGDLIFIKETIALGGSATVLLPFPAAAFKHTSVGQGWDEIFDSVMRHVSVELLPPLHPKLPESSDDQNAAFEQCNAWIVDQLTELAAQAQDPDPMFLAVFRKTGSQMAGGTWDAIERWQNQGRRVELIDPLA